MNLVVSDLPIPIEQDGEAAYAKAVGLRLALGADEFTLGPLLSKNLDARDPEQFYYQLALVVGVADDFANPEHLPRHLEPAPINRQPIPGRERPLVVGFGPAGMFAALELIEHGVRPLVFERGQKLDQRTRSVQRFIDAGELDPESNIQFGEGGAGSYSDGKLFSRRHQNTSYVNRVLATLIRFGAPAEIGYIGKPHLGTDVLCRIVANIRDHILAHGGEIHYGAKMTDLLLKDGKACGLIINGAREYLSSHIYLALGHSARDTLALLHEKGVALEQKPITVGVRIEHPAATINRMRYGAKYHDYAGLGAATYSLNYTDGRSKRGVYTFCMCPGGEVINASSAEGMLVVNGMSYSRRASRFSNGALVATCQAGDYPSASPLAGLEFQRTIERAAFAAGGGGWRVPAQNLVDFLAGKDSGELNENSYRQGAEAADLRSIFPQFVVEGLRAAFAKWQAEVPLFISHEAILLGAETRTSCPVRILRNEHFESVNTKNLYPIGEGAGYTGGITSSAADAIRAIERYALP